MIITVSKFEDKTNDKGAWYEITDEKGKKHQLFGNKIPELLSKRPLVQERMTCELVNKQNGFREYNGKQIANWETVDIKASNAAEAVKKEESSQYTYKYFEQMSMNRRTALMQSCSTTQNHDVVSILDRAEYFVNWLEKGEVPPNPSLPSPLEREPKDPGDFLKRRIVETLPPPQNGGAVSAPISKVLDLTSDEAYQKTVSKIYSGYKKDLEWTAATWNKFIDTNKDKWGGKVKWKELIEGERIIFVNLLQKEAKGAK